MHVPPGVTHQLRNTGNSDVRFLVVSSPDNGADRRRTPA
jgi:mannose-6-phosphate isomerase-like protein (cupin superfamily)